MVTMTRNSPSPVGRAVSEDIRRWAREDPEFRDEVERLLPYEQVARAVIRLRVDYGLTQDDLARRVGTTKSAISRLESGQHSPNIATLQKVARAFGRSVRISFADMDDTIDDIL
jgi:DNA-binding XRE family transcriptional regulator